MSEISHDIAETKKRIKQLENQNLKLRKLLTTALDVTDEDSEGMSKLSDEAQVLAERVSNLEKAKQQLEYELDTVNNGGAGSLLQLVRNLEKEHLELREKLDIVLTEIKKGYLEIEDLKSEDAQLKEALLKLEDEKEQLLEKLKTIEQAKSTLSWESMILQQKLSQIESKKSSLTKTLKTAESKTLSSEEELLSNFKYIEQTYKNYIEALEDHNSLEDKNSQLQNKTEKLKNTFAECEQTKSQMEINKAIIDSNTNLLHKIKEVKSKLQTSLGTNQNLMRTLEEPNNPAQIDVNISELENQRDLLYEHLERSLEHSSNEISGLSEQLSDPEVKRLVNEIEVQKTLLLYNLKLLKLRESQTTNEDIPQLPNIPNSESNIDYSMIPTISELETRAADLSSEPEREPTVHSPPPETEQDSNSDASTSRSDHQKLEEEITRLENERKILLKRLHSMSETSAQRFEERQLQTQSELHSTFMREHSSQEMVIAQRYDDATNQLYGDEDARLEQRIRELENENERIKRELDQLVEQFKNDQSLNYQLPEVLRERIEELENKSMVKK